MRPSRDLARRIFLFLVVMTGAGHPKVLSAQTPLELFVTAAPPAAADARLATVAVRQRHVTIDFAQLRSTPTAAAADIAADRVALNLFADVTLVAERDRVDRTDTATVWVGHIPGIDSSAVSLSIAGGVMYGSVLTPEATYIVRPAGSGGVHVVIEVDQSRFPREGDPLVPSAPGADAGASSAPDALPADDGSIVDVMVLYTPAAQNAAGGSSAIAALVNNAISTTNTTYANSGITQRLRLVYSGLVSYTETGGSTGLSQDLSNLTYGAGSLSGVAGLRNTYHADLVSLFTDTPGSAYCGIAWFMQSVSSAFDAYGYSVVEQQCAVGNLTFPHELGHNMGARHDWFVDAGVLPYTYSHGYINTTTRVRTVMSYNDLCASLGMYCSRVPYWSNPGLTYSGGAIGIAGGTNSTATCNANLGNPPCDADDHRTLNNTAYTVSNFRQSGVSVTALAASVSSPTTAGTPVTWTASAVGGTAPYTYRFWVYDGTNWTVAQDWSTANSFVWTPSLPGSYTLQVWVRNAGSVATYDAWRSAAFSVVAPPPLTVTSIGASSSTGVPGSPVVWTATASGGTAPYTFRFYLFDGTTWSIGQDWSASSTWTWTPTTPGSYSVQVWVRNAGSSASYDAWRAYAPFQVAWSPLSLGSLTSTPPFPVSVNTPVTLMTTASGGIPPHSYKVFAYNGTTWSLVQDWTTSNVWSWTPAATGSYTFQVWVRNAGSSAAYDAWRSYGPYQVTAPLPLTVTALQSDRTFPVPAGTPVRWTAGATGGATPYTFKFYVYDGATWALVQDWTASNVFDWVPTSAGTYSVQAWARNAGSSSTYDSWRGASGISISAPAPLTVSSLDAGGSSYLTAGAQVAVKAVATGGLGPYTYRFYLYDGSTWSVGQDWNASNVWVWTPAATGTYSIQVWVRNAGSSSNWDAWKATGPITVVP